MEKLKLLADTYSIYESDTDCAKEIAEFIVKENYGHHLSRHFMDSAMIEEIDNVCTDERSHKNSLFYLARTSEGKLIGSIRVFKWNRKDLLPIEEIFHINPLKRIGDNINYSYWHVGRLAIEQDPGFSTLTMFKELMALAISPIVQDSHGYMIAETDCKLLRVMNMLGINTTVVGEPVNHLASMTVPIYSSRMDLMPYYNRVMQSYKIDNHTKVWKLNMIVSKYTFVS